MTADLDGILRESGLGRRFRVGPSQVLVKVEAADTGGRFALIETDLAVVSMSREARQWLAEIDGAGSPGRSELPLAVYAAAARPDTGRHLPALSARPGGPRDTPQGPKRPLLATSAPAGASSSPKYASPPKSGPAHPGARIGSDIPGCGSVRRVNPLVSPVTVVVSWTGSAPMARLPLVTANPGPLRRQGAVDK